MDFLRSISEENQLLQFHIGEINSFNAPSIDVEEFQKKETFIVRSKTSACDWYSCQLLNSLILACTITLPEIRGKFALLFDEYDFLVHALLRLL